MANKGIVLRRDLKSALISGIPSPGVTGSWIGPVIEGEIVFATDTKEFGFLDTTGSLTWVSVDKIGKGGSLVKDGDGYRISGLSSDTLGSNAVNLASDYGTCNSSASGQSSFAEGVNTVASGPISHAEGYGVTSSGPISHAEGYGTTAEGLGSHAEGHCNYAEGSASHVEGCGVAAKGKTAHAEGSYTKAINNASHAEGMYNVGTATDTIHETGIGTSDSDRKNAFEIYIDGRLVAPELSTTLINTNRSLVTKEYVDGNKGSLVKDGDGYRISGLSSDTLGSNAVNLASDYGSGNSAASGFYSIVSGVNTTASGLVAHAEGYGTTASGPTSHAEGYGGTASGQEAHAEGVNTTASGEASHAEGSYTIASGKTAHAEGSYTKAINNASHVEGMYNVGTATDTIHETGIGTSDSDRKNAFEIYIDGRLVAPELSTTLINTNRSLATKEYVDGNKGSLVKDGEGYRISGLSSDTLGSNAINLASDYGSGNSAASGFHSIVTGINTIASGDISHAEGYHTTASGPYSFAEGANTIASGDNSHAEGANTIASGDNSHAEGGYSTASESNSHAEGYHTTASGNNSHAEGGYSTASGYNSHAEGYYTTTSVDNSHVEGMFNVGTATDTIHETGIGTSDSDRKNAFEIYKDGRLVAPELSTTLINTNRSLVTKEYVDVRSLPTGGSNGSIAFYNGTDWVILSVNPTNPGDILVWDGSTWVADNTTFGNNLPTSDPANPGQLWNNSGVVTVSS